MISLKIAQAGCDLPDATENHHPEPPRQRATILELRRNHIAIDVLACDVAAQFIIGSIDAFTIERWIPSSRAIEKVVGQNLFASHSQTAIVVEGEAVGLE